ncbi:hypothetical protein GWO43_14395 [candidate division KSB1 bacterium]|nr:hypothetical protein [candidate division KSB1 bacterium]NIR68470.1 hypothetical protein [candidate division KSB1 bacterium]NIS25121.1 hypothetical protein [candidate division KSB1 bacterium]NIT72033.1 hypothetical protein [candidate division KSB1 bacterium]NIU25820.1 hypothetical protein [candidate division KSB1 bacterium]
MRSKIQGYFAILRPINVALGMASIFIGAIVGGDVSAIERLGFACFSGALIMAGGNVINDYFDIEIDRINRPLRPIPSNQVDLEDALRFSIILFALGVFLSILINVLTLAIAVFASLGLVYYSSKLKRTILLGNIAVSFFAALAFVYGGVAVGHWKAALIPAALAFLFHLGREIVKDVEDQAGDKSQLAQTLSVRFGQKTSFITATIVFTFLLIFTFIPYSLDIYGVAYLWTVLIGVDLVVLGSLIYMWTSPFPRSLRRISTILKADMLVGLMAILIGATN